MRLIAALALVSVISLCATPADASEWSLEKFAKRDSGWKGHGVGSTYTETTTIPMPNIPNMPDVPGMPKGGKMVTTTVQTLKAVNKDSYTIEVRSTSMGRTTTTTRTEPKTRTFDVKAEVKDAGDGVVKIGGKDYACKVKTIANMESFMGDNVPKGPPGRAGSPTLSSGKVWEHPKHGVLKMETTASIMGQSAKMTWQVSNFSVSHTLGTQSFTCREMTMTTVTSMGTSKATMLTSLDFPGGTLKNVMENNMMGRKMTITTLVTAYTKKPLAVTTGTK